MITCGYIGGPAAQAIQFDETQQANSYGNATVVLLTQYWPAPYAVARRESFADPGLPYSCVPGTCLMLPHAEASALVAAGAARW